MVQIVEWYKWITASVQYDAVWDGLAADGSLVTWLNGAAVSVDEAAG